MTQPRDAGATRRGFLTKAAGLAIAVPGIGAAVATPSVAKPEEVGAAARNSLTEPFWGMHQAGIITPAQSHTYFVALDLTTTERNDLVRLLQAWTAAAARLADGQPIEPFERTDIAGSYDIDTSKTVTASEEPGPTEVSLPDTGDAQGLPAARLTVTFGFGAGLFVKDGKDRYGLASLRPEALIDLPHFVGDQLIEGNSGGDLSIQACADDPQVAFHAARQLVRLADEVAQVRWAQTGFLPGFGPDKTPRNLMGFRDGTNNPATGDAALMNRAVWVGAEGPAWMRGGSYVVARRIRIALEHWDRTPVAFQEQTVGRHKNSGAPLGMKAEADKLNLDMTDKDGNPLIAENAHVRLAAPETNDGAQILRRPYSYNDGVRFTAERWPPWRQGIEYDAGLFFICYQRDPRSGFVRIYERMAKLDMMNQFVTHVGGGLYACPGGITDGRYIGQGLFEGV